MDNSKAHILSTAPLPQTLTDKAAAGGVMIDVVPFISIKPLQDEKLSQGIRETLSTPAVIVITSANALRAIAKAQPALHTGSKIYCVGENTAKLARGLYGEGVVTATADNAAALAKKIIADGIAKDVVFFCGNKRRDELPQILKDAGIAVQEMIVYETIETPEKIIKPYDAVLFYSPSAVSSFFSCNTLPASTALFAIGQTTAAALQEFTKNRIIISEHTAKEALLDKAIAFYNNKAVIE